MTTPKQPDEPKEYLKTLLLNTLSVVRANTEYTAQAIIATSAMVDAMFDLLPEFAAKYDGYRAKAQESSPLAVQIREVLAELDQIRR